jgi:hypothetical protein
MDAPAATKRTREDDAGPDPSATPGSPEFAPAANKRVCLDAPLSTTAKDKAYLLDKDLFNQNFFDILFERVPVAGSGYGRS